jgi:hypothetical protein
MPSDGLTKWLKEADNAAPSGSKLLGVQDVVKEVTVSTVADLEKLLLSDWAPTMAWAGTTCQGSSAARLVFRPKYAPCASDSLVQSQPGPDHASAAVGSGATAPRPLAPKTAAKAVRQRSNKTASITIGGSITDDGTTKSAAVQEASHLDKLVRWVVDTAWSRMRDGSTLQITDMKKEHKKYLPHVTALPQMIYMALRKLGVTNTLQDINTKLRK